jgi:hypothetical protein
VAGIAGRLRATGEEGGGGEEQQAAHRVRIRRAQIESPP